MAASHIKFAELREMLSQLGYEQVALAGDFRGFERGSAETLIALPAYRNGQNVVPRHLASVRVMLANQGIMTPAEFDQFWNARQRYCP